jgi:hypothetical protein
MAQGTITLDLKTGPTLALALRVVETGTELLDLIPDWNAAERRKLEARLVALADQIEAGLGLGQRDE